MRRVSLKMLLLSCTALLLAMDGCSSPTFTSKRKTEVRAVAGDEDGDKESPRPEKGPPFRLPDDQAGRLLGEALPPAAKLGALRNPKAPPPASVPWPRLDDPRLSLPARLDVVSRLPQPVRKGQLQPRLVIEEGLGEPPDRPAVPQRQSFAVGRRTVIASEDASVPPPLPVMAQPVLDRVPLNDATAEASNVAVLEAVLPQRATPAPFVRTRVPEPFANRRPLATRVPDEETTPVADSPATPKS
jgi:hypothetical protein